jgi:hypothetical protein
VTLAANVIAVAEDVGVRPAFKHRYDIPPYRLRYFQAAFSHSANRTDIWATNMVVLNIDSYV